MLDEHEGVLLREISEVTTQIVDGIFYGSIGPSMKFVIENVESEQIMNSPKGSSRLLELLSPIASSMSSKETAHT